MASEKAITATITRNLTREGIFWLKIHGSPYQRRGTPDLLVVQDGRAYFFEVKQPGKEPTKLQRHRLDELRKKGIQAHVVHNWAGLFGILTMWG
ncbi:hypothetical protein LCGC14_0817620 [marine sediment metagenome]|uniref:VRR-NUC domain-containing protein n=1 Tax=marine sediment metagenome TaxID=412755 RepID=A0A0F9S4R5_9ZZZZ